MLEAKDTSRHALLAAVTSLLAFARRGPANTSRRSVSAGGVAMSQNSGLAGNYQHDSSPFVFSMHIVRFFFFPTQTPLQTLPAGGLAVSTGRRPQSSMGSLPSLSLSGGNSFVRERPRRGITQTESSGAPATAPQSSWGSSLAGREHNPLSFVLHNVLCPLCDACGIDRPF